ncbi:MAG: glycosyltransferase family 87 protein [Myxococcota bacterium]
MNALQRMLVVVGAAAVLVVLAAMVLRVGFPLELEWMEGGVLHQAHRFANGQALYPQPGRDFVPFLYTPGFAVLLGSLGKVFGLSYALGRVISIVSCVAIGWAIWTAVGTASRPVGHRVAAIGLFASGYVFTFRWLDLARPDTMSMALILWALVLLRRSRGRHKTAIAAGLLMALAFWTKQTAATFVIASGIGALWVAPRQAVSYAVTIAIVDGGGVLLGNAVTDGLLWHYIYELHQTHAFNQERFEKKTWGMFLHAGPFVLLALLVGLAQVGRQLRAAAPDQRRAMSTDAVYWALMAVTGLLVSALGYSTQWAEPNAFIPGVLMGAIVVGVVFPERGPWGGVAAALVTAQILFSLAVEPMYQPLQSKGWSLATLRQSYAWQRLGRTVPSGQQRANAAALRVEIEAEPAALLAIQRPWWNVLAGHEPHVGSMGITDVLPEDRKDIQAALRAELREGGFGSVWLEGEPPRWMSRALRDYTVRRRLHGEDRIRPLSGYMSEAGMVTPYRADQLWLAPAGPRPMPEGTIVVADFESGTSDDFTPTGAAFGRRAMRGTGSSLPPVGPLGGLYLYGSVGRRGQLAATGTARSAPFSLPKSGSVRLLLGSTGRVDALRAALVDTEDPTRRVELEIPRGRLQLHPVRWDVEDAWAGRSVVLELRDDAKKAAVFVDDVWVVPGP